MAWNLSGRMVEACSCNMLCPCWYGVKELMVMDQGWCSGPQLFQVKSGQSEGVELADVRLVFAPFFPGPTLLDGDATARLYFDEAVTSDQHRELETIMQGQRGGPMEILASLVRTWLPTQTVKIDVRETDGVVDAVVDGVGEIHSKQLKNEAGQAMTMQNVGFALALKFDDQTAVLAPSDGTRWEEPGFPHVVEAKSGAVATFRWSGS